MRFGGCCVPPCHVDVFQEWHPLGKSKIKNTRLFLSDVCHIDGLSPRMINNGYRLPATLKTVPGVASVKRFSNVLLDRQGGFNREFRAAMRWSKKITNFPFLKILYVRMVKYTPFLTIFFPALFVNIALTLLIEFIPGNSWTYTTESKCEFWRVRIRFSTSCLRSKWASTNSWMSMSWCRHVYSPDW